MCLKIRCKSVKENLVFPILSFIFVFISINLSLFTIFKEHYIIKNIYTSFGDILSFIPLLISLRLSRASIHNINNNNNNLPKKNVHKDNIKSLKINYEYNDQLEEITKIKWYSLFFLSLIDFLQVISLYLGFLLFQAKNDIFFWVADILSLYLFSKIFLNTAIHRHHILSLFIFSLFDIYLSITIILGPNFNYWQIACIIFNNFLYALKVVYAKKLMDFNFISYYKLCFIIGLITLLYNVITLGVETFIDEKKYIPSEYELFIDNVFVYWNQITNENYKIIIKEICLSIIYMFTMGISNIFLYITLFYLTPFHVLIIKIFLCIGFNLIIKIGDTLLSYNFIINISIFVISIFVLFFFLEIIECECCGLNNNTKEKIQERTLDKNDALINENSINESSSKTEGDNNTHSSLSYTDEIN